MSSLRKNQLANWKRGAQLAVVLLGALALKLYYSTASANQLRWILAPTTALVELVSGRSFAFESHAGYISGDRSFLIAASCAGVNFLLTSFLMLALRKLWRDRAESKPGNPARSRWSFIPLAALVAYLTTLVANTARISIALWLQRQPLGTGWLNPNQLHRLEGILVYFGFLLLLFVLGEKLSSRRVSDISPQAREPRRSLGLFRRAFFPLVIYYVMALGLPLANSAYHRGIAASDFWEHSLFVLLTPLVLLLLLALVRLYSDFTRLNDLDHVLDSASRTRSELLPTKATAHPPTRR
jgi:exosortase K